MARIWTEAQSDAIDSRNGNILVSAAAGSGKTAVLVERVIKLLTDEENPTGADRILVVTFTKAAAAEMRERISTRLAQMLRKNPSNSNLIRQRMLLPSAKICTIDSFCGNLVRDNFQLLDISPELKVADDGELSDLRKEAIDQTLEEMYRDSNEDFHNLVEQLFKGSDDSFLEEIVLKLYDYSMSFPFPERWLESLVDTFHQSGSIAESIYGNIIFDYIGKRLNYCLEICDEILDYSFGDEYYSKTFTDLLTSDKNQLLVMKEYAHKGDWNNTRDAVSNFSSLKKLIVNKNIKDLYQSRCFVTLRKNIVAIIKELKAVMCCDEKEFGEDMEFFQPIVSSLCQTTKLFSKNYSQLKKEKNVAEFNDISHYALMLLTKEQDGKFLPTDFAKTVSESFDQILIDEYQDTNNAQDMLFNSISRNNLFRVGDVKQSIYGFRLARPEIFLDLKKSYELYDREKDNYPGKIILGNNFRSRKGVTDIINFVFSQLMTGEMGDIEYNSEEELVASAQYCAHEQADAEFHLLEEDLIDKDCDSKDSYQAKYIANLINTMIADGYTVKDGDGERKATYKDFCVLMRGIGKTKGVVYADEFRKAGVPSYTEIASDFFCANEVNLTLCILRIIDNPKQDVPLVTVMMSWIFGYTADDVSKIRLDGGRGDIYECLIVCREKGNEKATQFLEKISHWRNISSACSCGEILEEIYDDTALLNIVDALDKSGTKRSNLMLLLDYAQTYEISGYRGISGFIRFVDRLRSQKRDLAGSMAVSAEADVVKIMTIHKSKGLEFPVCILANCGGRFNRQDESDNIILSLSKGIGLVRRDEQTFLQHNTLSHEAVKKYTRLSSMSEEMRVLYVAMTRAKEKLIMIYSYKNIENKCLALSADINPNRKKISGVVSSGAVTYGDWLLSTFLRHKDARALREKIGADESIVLDCPSQLKVVFPESLDSFEKNITQSEELSTDESFRALIDERVKFNYKYAALSDVVTKRAASQVDKNSIDRDYFASSKPAFLMENGLTGAQRGVATHTFMQFANYEKARVSVKGEIERLLEMGFINDVQASGINIKAVENFFCSDLAERIVQSPLVMREKKFTIEIPVNEIYEIAEDFPEEKMMIQGIADCAFLENGKLIVVDYKTDSLESEKDFTEKYSDQVKMYKKALTLCTDYPVTETLLYSFHLGKEIKI